MEYKIGDHVRVKRTHCLVGGAKGKIISINSNDKFSPIRVAFEEPFNGFESYTFKECDLSPVGYQPYKLLSYTMVDGRPQCVCDIKVMFDEGCKCGAFEKERWLRRND